jgi:hypothetical protein
LVLVFLVVLLVSCTSPAAKTAVETSENLTAAVISPKPWPRVGEFLASSENVTPGENVTLQWEVLDAATISIDQGVGKVQSKGTAVVSPQRTTKYTLTASGEKGVSTAWVTVLVPEKIVLMPDLIITGITYNSGLLYYTIKNIGGADAGPSDTYLYDQSNMWRDTSWVNGLKAGEEKTQPFTNFNYHGDKITVCADGGKNVAEANEDNNCLVPAFGFKFNYDFSQFSSRAVWRGSAGRVEFGLEGENSKGWANKLNTVVAGDGQAYRNAIEILPPPEGYGWVEGVFGDWQEQWSTGGYMLPLELPNNARFTARVGMSKRAEGGSGVTFLFGLMAADGGVDWFPSVKASSGGTPQDMNIDLSHYAGQKVRAVLRVEGGADTQGAFALWIDPRITQ